MAVTFRGAKGTALTHAELDQNFSEFILSGSVSGTTLTLYRSSSTYPFVLTELPKAGGDIGNVQMKSDNGTWEGVSSFNYKWWDQELFLTASTYQQGNIYLDGTIYAHQFQTTLVSSSVLYRSGSTKFGDTTDDFHQFTGSLRATGDIVSNVDIIADGAIQAGQALIFNDLTVDGRVYGDTDYNTLLNKPTLVSGSSQIILGNTSGFSTYSSSVHTQREHKHQQVKGLTLQNNLDINALESSVDVMSSSFDSRINNSNSGTTALSSSLNNSIGLLSSSVENNYLLNTTDTLEGDLTVTGTITAQEFKTEYITSSVIYESGSTKFGDSADDTHEFTGSVYAYITGSITNADNATLAQNSLVAGVASTASYATTAATATSATSAATATTASYATTALTASYALNAGSALTSETDPIFTAHPTFNIAQADIDDWDTAAGWGDHSVEGYARATDVASTYVAKAGDDISGDLEFTTAGKGLNFGYQSSGGYSGQYGGTLKYYDANSTNKLELSAIDELSFVVDGTARLGITDVQASFSVPVTSTNDIIAYASSDKRLKENITPISDPIEKVKAIGGYEFDWNDKQPLHKGHDVGVIAQEIEAILPELVQTRDNGYKAVSYEKIVALLIEAIKDQQSQIDELKLDLLRGSRT
jgi:hypothetical protein